MLALSTTLPPVQKVVAGDVIFAVGAVSIVIVLIADVALQPAAFVISTVYELAAVAMYVEAVPT